MAFGLFGNRYKIGMVVAFAVVTVGVANAALTDGLVGYYSFDGNLDDLSGSVNVNNAAAVGSPDLAVAGLFGGGVKVGDGSGTSYVSLGTPSDYLFGDSTSFTITYWLKMPASQASDPGLIGNKNWSATGGNQGFVQAIAGDDVKANVADGSTRADTSSIDLDHDAYWDGQGKGPLDPVRWTFVAITVNRSSNILTDYVMDGWVTSQWNDSSTPTTVGIGAIGSLDSGYPINIGQDGDGVGYDNSAYPELVATFDDMAVWRRALSTAEIWEIYTAGRAGQSFADYAGVSAYVQITESGGATEVTEGGSGDDYEIVLSAQPTETVQVTATPGDAQINIGSGPGVPLVLDFTTGNWQTPRTVSVTAFDDDIYEGETAHKTTITHTADGGEYTGVTISSVEVSVIDDELTCGDWGYFATDLNRDCYVDLRDFAKFALEWLTSPD